LQKKVILISSTLPDFCFVEVDVTTKATKRCITLSQKVKLIEDSMKPGFSQDKAAKEYGISQSAVCKILKNKFNIYCNSASSSNIKKNLSRGKNDALEETLYEWYLQRKTAGLPISGPLLRSKAEELANSFTCSAEAGFKFSNGWLDGFKRRYDIRFTNIIYKKRESKKSGSIKSEPLDPTTGHFLA
jgi:predicted transcriptional regulator